MSDLLMWKFNFFLIYFFINDYLNKIFHGKCCNIISIENNNEIFHHSTLFVKTVAGCGLAVYITNFHFYIYWTAQCRKRKKLQPDKILTIGINAVFFFLYIGFIFFLFLLSRCIDAKKKGRENKKDHF